MKELKIGDRIYVKCYHKIVAIYTVQRITKTMAICENGTKKFKPTYDENSGYIHKMGDTDKFNSFSYYIENEKLVEEKFRMVSLEIIKKAIQSENLSIEQIKSILAILNL